MNTDQLISEANSKRNVLISNVTKSRDDACNILTRERDDACNILTRARDQVYTEASRIRDLAYAEAARIRDQATRIRDEIHAKATAERDAIYSSKTAERDALYSKLTAERDRIQAEATKERDETVATLKASAAAAKKAATMESKAVATPVFRGTSYNATSNTISFILPNGVSTPTYNATCLLKLVVPTYSQSLWNKSYTSCPGGVIIDKITILYPQHFPDHCVLSSSDIPVAKKVRVEYEAWLKNAASQEDIKEQLTEQVLVEEAKKILGEDADEADVDDVVQAMVQNIKEAKRQEIGELFKSGKIGSREMLDKLRQLLNEGLTSRSSDPSSSSNYMAYKRESAEEVKEKYPNLGGRTFPNLGEWNINQLVSVLMTEEQRSDYFRSYDAGHQGTYVSGFPKTVGIGKYGFTEADGKIRVVLIDWS